MKNKFPIIETINDVLPHIKDRKEFVIAEREYGIICNYLVNMPDTFTIDPNDPLPGLIRRECRGITFYPNGKIMSRKFNKFFNIGELDETRPEKIDFSKPHKILKKLDGSMVSPMIASGPNPEIIWCSKMGITFISPMVAAFVVDKQYYNDFAHYCIAQNITPIFEFISPDNRIVLHYEFSNLVLLAARHNVSGEYIDLYSSEFADIVNYYKIPKVDTINSFNSVNDLIDFVKPLKNEEGFVIAFDDGQRYKIKADEYVLIHKNKDMIRSNRNIVAFILNNELDDLIPHLDKIDTNRVREFESVFWNAIAAKVEYITKETDNIISKYSGDRKRIATEELPNINDKTLSMYVFGKLGGKDVRDMVMATLNKNMNADIRFEEFWQWVNETK